MEFINSIWNLYTTEPMFTVGFVLGNSIIFLLYALQHAHSKIASGYWDHFPWYVKTYIVVFATCIWAILSALWPITMPAFVLWLIWVYPCYWIGKFITDRLPKHKTNDFNYY